jgi:uncharacterized protein YdaU (DUF1376 family)
MSLPWFPFNIKDFLANTKRLNTEAKGAYLCLMLDYYEQEGPPPDDDDVLASICELPPDVWKRHRKVIEPLFEIRDGCWHHARIEREIENGNTKLAQSKARAQAGAAAMHAKKGHKLAPSSPQAAPKQQEPEKPAPSQLAAKPEQRLEDAHLTLTKEESLSVLDVTVEKDNSGDNPLVPPPDQESLGTPIDVKFWPTENHIAMCRFDGADDETVNTEVQKFVLHHLDKGSWSADWNASFAMWWHRWKEHQASRKKAAPRIEVTKAHVPSEAEWRSYLLRWKSDGFWPRAGGADPSTGRCKAPLELFEKLGIDPKTGLSAPVKEPAT